MYQEFPVQILNKEYKVMGVIDNGAEGSKKIVHHIDDDQEKKNMYLVKILPCTNKNDTERYEREINILKKLDHPNIAKIVDVFRENNQIMIFFSYYSGGSLADMLDENRLPEEVARSYFRQLVESVRYCHKNNIAHRDIKPDNILVESDKKSIVLTDFGLSKEIIDLFDDFPGTVRILLYFF